MFRSFVVLAFLSAFVAAQMPAPNPAILLQVQHEELNARKFLDATLKLQHAQYGLQASSLYLQISQIEQQENSKAGDISSFLEVPRGLEEEDEAIFVDGTAETDMQQAKLDLYATLAILNANAIRSHQAIFAASDLQREFYLDRVVQLSASSTPGVPPQVLQLLYVKSYVTLLKTMKLSHTLQMISHWRTWLEDVLDVDSSIIEGADTADEVVLDQEDDLIHGQKWAFYSLSNVAMLDLQVFYIEWYLESAMASMAGAAAAAAAAPAAPAPAPAPAPAAPAPAGPAAPAPAPRPASFLEEESQEEAQFASMGSMFTAPMMLKYFKMYFLMLQSQAASAGLASAFMEEKSYQIKHDGDSSNDGDAESYHRQAQQFFTYFASNVYQASQLEYMGALYAFYALYAPSGGSFGSL